MHFLNLVLLAATLFYFGMRKRNKYHFPPGPLGLPFLGNIHQLIARNPFEKFKEWAEKFGKIYTINICTKSAVVINDPKLMRIILNTFESTGKYLTDSMLLISQGPYGVLNSEGETWSEQKSFCVKKLKEFGFGNKRMETLILCEANEMCDWITKQNDRTNNQPIHMNTIFLQSVINTLWTMVSGTRITLGDKNIKKLLDAFMTTFQYTMKTGLMFLPWLKYLAPGLSGYTAFNNACLDVTKYIEQDFMEHKKTLKSGAPRDLIDAYIEESENDPLKWKNAVATIVELFLAGSETTGSIMVWLLCYLSVNPEIQSKLQKEIDAVVGENGEISLDHKSCMPYTEAVILEAMRLSTLIPIGVIHQLMDDLEIEGYKFPKGLILIPNIFHCHYNKDVWEDPEVFRPERFLDDQGAKLKEHVIPFQQGRRQCVGEPLARNMLFIFVARIFQIFDVTPDKSEDPMDYYKPSDVGYSHVPPTLGLCITRRKK